MSAARPLQHRLLPRLANRRPVVFLVGGVPLPVGGITIHVERLAALLCDHGFDVEVFDITGAPFEPTSQRPHQRVWRGPSWWTLTMLAMRLVVTRPVAVHWHVSNLRRAGRLLTPMRLLAAFVPTFLTVHSGKFPSGLRNASAAVRRRFGAFCHSAAAIIGVSDAIVQSIRALPGVRPDRIHKIPAYLTADQAPSSAEPRRRRPGIVGMVCGFGTSLYGWDAMSEALKISAIEEWHWVFYTVFDDEYVAGVIARAEEIAPGKVRVHRNLAPEAFQELLKSSDVLVRPTLSDGDSLAVREALSLGLTVLASDAAARPPECTLFRAGDAADIAAKLQEIIESPRARQSDPRQDFSLPLLRLFQSATSHVPPPDAQRAA